MLAYKRCLYSGSKWYLTRGVSTTNMVTLERFRRDIFCVQSHGSAYVRTLSPLPIRWAEEFFPGGVLSYHACVVYAIIVAVYNKYWRMLYLVYTIFIYDSTVLCCIVYTYTYIYSYSSSVLLGISCILLSKAHSICTTFMYPAVSCCIVHTHIWMYIIYRCSSLYTVESTLLSSFWLRRSWTNRRRGHKCILYTRFPSWYTVAVPGDDRASSASFGRPFRNSPHQI